MKFPLAKMCDEHDFVKPYKNWPYDSFIGFEDFTTEKNDSNWGLFLQIFMRCFACKFVESSIES